MVVLGIMEEETPFYPCFKQEAAASDSTPLNSTTVSQGSLPPAAPFGQAYFLTDQPVYVVCVNCGQHAYTRTEVESGLFTYLACFSIALCGAFCGCCLIPFCVSECKDKVHYCPNCELKLGRMPACT